MWSHRNSSSPLLFSRIDDDKRRESSDAGSPPTPVDSDTTAPAFPEASHFLEEKVTVKSSKPVDKTILGLRNEIGKKLTRLVDDEIVILVNTAIEAKEISLEDAADCLYALCQSFPAQRELRGAAQTLLLEAYQHNLAASEWRQTRLEELEFIASHIYLSIWKLFNLQEKMDLLLSASAVDLAYLDQLSDLANYNLAVQSLITLPNKGPVLSAIANLLQYSKALHFNHYVKLSSLIRFFQQKDTPELRAAALKFEPLAKLYKRRHDEVSTKYQLSNALELQHRPLEIFLSHIDKLLVKKKLDPRQVLLESELENEYGHCLIM